MIHYGVSAKHLKNGILKNVHCPHCGADTNFNYSIYGRYAHVFHVPFLKSGKAVLFECENCRKAYDLKKLPEAIKKQYHNRENSNDVKLPWWYNIGMIISLLIIAACIYTGIQEGIETDKKIKTYIQAPKSGDLYHISFERGHYSTLKVANVSKDSVEVLVNNMETNLYSGIEKIDIPANYTSSKVLSKKELAKMCADEIIYEITRK